MTEDPRAFPYSAISETLKNEYAEIFQIKEPLPPRPLKVVFDRAASFFVLILVSPLFLVIFAAYLVDGLIFKEDRGSIFISYKASSCGKKFDKYKFRLIKESCIDPEARSRGEWSAFASERDGANRTRLGNFLKKYYLDELPQIFNIFFGDMSFVGPRALAWHHYQRDIGQGNIARKILKAGLFSDSHSRKGTPMFADPELEYKYIKNYIRLNGPALLWLDLRIIARGIRMILQGKGY